MSIDIIIVYSKLLSLSRQRVFFTKSPPQPFFTKRGRRLGFLSFVKGGGEGFSLFVLSYNFIFLNKNYVVTQQPNPIEFLIAGITPCQNIAFRLP